jgi:capsular exopolysaccharide synthesis family protein
MTAQRGLQQVDATVESHAIAQANPAYKSLRFVAMVAAIIAAIGGILAVLLSEMWTPRIRSADDVWRATSLPIAGLLPQVQILREPGNAAREIVDNPLTMVAEAFRNLGAYLSTSSRFGRSKIIAITSSVPGEGKTMSSLCLARTLAATGSRVVLLDCDVRRAGASQFFPKATFGIAEIFDQDIPMERALMVDSKTGLCFLAGSVGPEVPTNLFTGNQIDQLLETLGKKFDRIVIDTPPLLGFADTRLLVSKSDLVLHVVQWNKTPETVVRAAVRILRQCNARVAGVVLNQIDIEQQSLYGFADGSDYFQYYGSNYPKLA